jgi:hypothetical protein
LDTDSDFDDDGLTDGEEVEIYSTSPTNAHSLSESQGTGTLYTDWQLVDLTDADEGVGDGIPDRIEAYFGLNPLGAETPFWIKIRTASTMSRNTTWASRWMPTSPATISMTMA